MKITIAISSIFLLLTLEFCTAHREPCHPTTTASTTTKTPRPPSPTHIYFATFGAGIQSYSLATSAVSIVVASDEELQDVAYNPINRKIYYCNYTRVFWANLDGSANEALESNVDFVHLKAIDLDGLTGNLYAVTRSYDNNIFICNTNSSRLICAVISTTVRYFNGIFLDPLRREMLIAGESGIYRANMDASDLTALVTGNSSVAAEVIADPDSDRLYWTNYRNDRIVSSFRNGTGVEILVQLKTYARPAGLAKLGDLIYWGNVVDSKTLQSIGINGEDVVTLYNGTSGIGHLTLIPLQNSRNVMWDLENGGNSCEGQGCSHICILQAKSFRCLCPEGLELAEDQRSCIVDAAVN